MNCWMGYICSPPNQPGYTIFRKTSSLVKLGPADGFVFMEERAESIDDGSFETQMGNSTIANWPTDYHNGAAMIGFADGHAESHKWRTAAFLQPQQINVNTKWGIQSVTTPADMVDLQWLQRHATVN
jgi:prepilin-type processing-associated H-X9-DG protein